MKKKERKENRCVVGAVSRSPRIVALRWQSLGDPSVRPPAQLLFFSHIFFFFQENRMIKKKLKPRWTCSSKARYILEAKILRQSFLPAKNKRQQRLSSGF
jgi:hypothetical protein